MTFWQTIKGLNQDNSNNNYFTYINFQAESGINPTITIADDGTTINRGNILTTGISQTSQNVTIYDNFIFNNALALNSALNFKNTTGANIKVANGNIAWLSYSFDGSYRTTEINGGLQTSYINLSGAALKRSPGDLSAKNLYVSTNTDISGYCKANYFNATSDKRAKTNINPLMINALDIIKETQVYTFKYKDTDTPSVGILAQDVQNINLEGFKIVDNENATGIDMDYMSIHESKLVYLLWKAIQEQQAQIDDLKAQLDKIKKD